MRYGCFILSKDTDVTVILLLSKSLYPRGIIHVLGENSIELDSLAQNLHGLYLRASTLSSLYMLTGCEFTPETHDVTHAHYFSAAYRHYHLVGYLSSGSVGDVFEFMTVLKYL